MCDSIAWLAKPKGPDWRRTHAAKWQQQRGYAEDMALCNAYLTLKGSPCTRLHGFVPCS